MPSYILITKCKCGKETSRCKVTPDDGVIPEGGEKLEVSRLRCPECKIRMKSKYETTRYGKTVTMRAVDEERWNRWGER